ncbi:bifunctional diaminohydroxyphosphoribosylaminopyrimidine deaminase/5-amino-6-(5-phosphoribosylamino)uracil reductase [Leptospira perolatii]|uniref:Riboflavin biosynthesis protein RibD n=1 Tax=Leptospira perolatii TaxID=2023191 RepID=A0A2M9ZL24_9LEPT|nr:dihydrofolate reductase family protein [Leptospira perolatii]PJZ70359.1 bifunctional diaminohydroxyphosphoribosylaminopyrimidine deaminase/5-amino-6-(5-phosphoribosylamino)uracil reductase [Leptospira perolatii]PJZ72757.1 bifunctional diaminohydroxyphosphoribosylaminopyrimidine deaminase/5-amino-6-(5-phosphoribosylamino)uracil reductase [Leptospira perolatii]
MNSALPTIVREELLRLSFLSTGFTTPNPPVACVITDTSNSKILALGRTQIAGGNHAEREAYLEFRSKFPKLPPHNVFVTLEPCTHFGKTPPCLDLILKEKPETVYIGWEDPNPLLKGRNGNLELENAGIRVVFHQELAKIASKFIFGFRNRILTRKPAILLKAAVTKEGFYTSGTGLREKISSTDSDFFLSYLRAKVDAILVGSGTVQFDHPGLDFKLPSARPLSDLHGPKKTGANLGAEGFSGLISEILDQGASESCMKVHLEKLSEYQPLRIFLLPEESRVSSSFLEKQEKLNLQYGRSLARFFIRGSGSTSYLDRLHKIAEGNVFSYSQKLDHKNIMNQLENWGVNLALVEGGNSLYRLFSEALENEDRILRIQSNQVSFLEGIKPDWGKDHMLEYRVELGTDCWEVFQKCSQD